MLVLPFRLFYVFFVLIKRANYTDCVCLKSGKCQNLHGFVRHLTVIVLSSGYEKGMLKVGGSVQLTEFLQNEVDQG